MMTNFKGSTDNLDTVHKAWLATLGLKRYQLPND